MSCKTCNHYKRPPKLGYDEIVGEKGECHFVEFVEIQVVEIQGYYRKVKPNESCCMDTTKPQSPQIEKQGSLV